MKQKITYLLSLTIIIAAFALSGVGAHTGSPEPFVPIGSIIAWHKTYTGVPALPSGWIECGGGTISDSRSPLNGQTIPNLNSGNVFLRGQTTSGGGVAHPTHVHFVGGATDIEDGDTEVEALSSDSATVPGFGHIHTFSVTSDNNATDALPPYFEVVWIMRIK